MLSTNILTVLAIASVVMFIGSLIVIPIIITRLPNNYFLDEKRYLLVKQNRHATSILFIQFLRNVLGIIFIVAGIAMLVLPGQGILTILIGLGITNFPGKYKLERKLISNQRVFRSLNWMRKRAGADPFIYPE